MWQAGSQPALIHERTRLCHLLLHALARIRAAASWCAMAQDDVQSIRRRRGCVIVLRRSSACRAAPCSACVRRRSKRTHCVGCAKRLTSSGCGMCWIITCRWKRAARMKSQTCVACAMSTTMPRLSANVSAACSVRGRTIGIVDGRGGPRALTRPRGRGAQNFLPLMAETDRFPQFLRAQVLEGGVPRKE